MTFNLKHVSQVSTLCNYSMKFQIHNSPRKEAGMVIESYSCNQGHHGALSCLLWGILRCLLVFQAADVWMFLGTGEEEVKGTVTYCIGLQVLQVWRTFYYHTKVQHPSTEGTARSRGLCGTTQARFLSKNHRGLGEFHDFKAVHPCNSPKELPAFDSKTAVWS